MASAVTTASKDFWCGVEKTKMIYSPESAVYFQGEKVEESAKEKRMESFRTCSNVHHFVGRLFSKPPMRVLDLGSGIGANTLPMAKFGAHVTAIDESRELLKAFAEKSVAVGCPSNNLRLRRGDITTMESYDGPFDLVVAIDILPYVPPATLRSTMEKIHKSLEERGLLIGTIFTTRFPPLVREHMEQLGACFYENGSRFVTQLLQYSGFTVMELEERPAGWFHFIAEKTPNKK